MKKILTSLLALTITTNVVGYTGYNYKLKEADATVIKLQDDIVTKSTEIARLDDTIKTQNENLKKQSEMIKDLQKKVEEQTLYNRKQEKLLKQVSRGEQKKTRKVRVVATSYIALCDTGCTGFTATGDDVRRTPSKQVIAVDPDIIPLYSKVRVNLPNGESFLATALDKGGDIQRYRIDILMATHKEAIEFGVQTVTVEVLREGKGI